MDQEQSSALADAFTYRIAYREELAAQVRFLDAVQNSPIASQVVLTGSSVLHGVFLHGRRTANLDLFMPPVAAMQFAEMIMGAGVSLEHRPIRNEYSIRTGSLVIPGLSLVVRVYPKQVLPFQIEPAVFTDASGRGIAVRHLHWPNFLWLRLRISYCENGQPITSTCGLRLSIAEKWRQMLPV